MFEQTTTPSFNPSGIVHPVSMSADALQSGGYVGGLGEYTPGSWGHGATTEDMFFGEELPMGLSWQLEDPNRTYEEMQPAAIQRVPRPGGGATGELQPVGDAVLPMIIFAAAYLLLKVQSRKVAVEQGAGSSWLPVLGSWFKNVNHNRMKKNIFTSCMTVLVMLAGLLWSAPAQAQRALSQGDTITVSYTTGGNTYYIACQENGNGTETVTGTPNERCLWVLSKMTGAPTAANGRENGAVVQAMSLYKDRKGETVKFLYMQPSNQGAMWLVSNNSQSNFYTIKSSQSANEYINANILVKSGRTNYYINYNWWFYAYNTNRPQTLRIQKWSGVTESVYRPTFLPNEIIFDYAANDAAANAQAISVTCKVTKREGKYYYNVSNPDQRIVLQQPTETPADGAANFEWELPWDARGQQMQFSTPQRQSDGSYTFTVTPVGPSPQVEENAVTADNPLTNVANHIVCEATFNGVPASGEMVCIRRAYVHHALAPLDFTVTHPTYTFDIGGSQIRLEPFLYVQNGEEWTNTDGVTERSNVMTMYYYDRDDDGKATSELKSANRYRVVYGDSRPQSSNKLVVQISNESSLPSWITFDGFTKWGMDFTAQANSGEEPRSAVVLIYVDYTHKILDEHGEIVYEADGITPKTIEGQFIRQVILRQPGSNSGAAIAFHHNGTTNSRGEQAVHTNKQVRYYIPGGTDVVELRPAETSFFAYRRWYNYDNGRGIQNSAVANDNTTWASAPSIQVTSGRTTTAYNFTPINTNSANSHGVFAIARTGSTSSGYRLLHDGQNEVMPTINPYANASGGPKHDGVHTIACDLSCYTDYTVVEDGGNLKEFTEPTLSYRMLFELRPATEIADRLAALPEGKYLEEYEITAPTGVDVHLTTSQRFRSTRYHNSELGYFYYTNPGAHTGLTRIKGGTTGNTITWKRNGIDYKNNTFSPNYSSNTDNAIVNSTKTGTVVYTLEIGGKRIAKFTVHYERPTDVGPSSVALLTNKEIADRYQVLNKVDWDDVDTKPGNNNNVISQYHLPWEDATFGFAYQKPTRLQTNRPTNQDLCYYGEYLLVNSWSSDSYSWMDKNIVNHTGKANGYMLFADGTMEPSMVACINTKTQICSGQQMYCSAWIANACPSGGGTGANPIFRFNVQGRNSDAEEWEDVEVFFPGELPKGSGWRQIKFQVKSHQSYSQTRVCVYNFATTNSGNDFYLDDLYLFATPLPISAYQASSACSGEDIVVVVKVDYQNIAEDLVNKEVYYQGWVETVINGDSVTVPIPDLGEFGGYYLWYDEERKYYDPKSKYEVEHNIAAAYPDPSSHVQDFGYLHIPSKNYTPVAGYVRNSVQEYIDYLHSESGRQSRAGMFFMKGDDGKYAMYLVHLLRARDGGNYEVRFAEDIADIASPLCAMSVKLPIYKQTKLTWGENDEPISTPVLDVCPNVDGEIKVTVTNTHIADNSTSGELETTYGRADWLVGIAADTIYGHAYVDRDVTPLPDGKRYVAEGHTIAELKILADTAFKHFYGYTREEVTSAFVYDLRRMPYVNHPNVNYDVTDYTKLDPYGFLDPQNYTIVRDLCSRGLVDLNVEKRTVILTPGESLFLWVYPIVGSAVLDGKELAVCNEPQWVDFRTPKLSEEDSQQIFNPSPIANENKTPVQKLMIPTVRLAASEAPNGFSVPVMNIQNAVLGWDSLRVIETNDPAISSKVKSYTDAYTAWESGTDAYPTPVPSAPNYFSMRYYADKVYQGTNGVMALLSNGDPNPDYYSDTKNPELWKHPQYPYNPQGDTIIFRPINSTYVDYLKDRRLKSTGELRDRHIYSATDADWVEKTISEETLPQPGFQFPNSSNAQMRANYTYKMKTNLLTKGFGGELDDSELENGCSYAVAYFDVLVVPDLLIWRPTVSNEWGNDANWHGIVNGVEMEWGFAPLPTSSVIIPEMENQLLYPVVTGENLYPMSAWYTPNACDNIYMESGAHILGQEKLQYNHAYVDMSVQHAQWQLMSSPLRQMYSGDMFIPHNGSDWSGATLENKPYTLNGNGFVNSLRVGDGSNAQNGNLFDAAEFTGIRSSNAPYAFWLSFYNRQVDSYGKTTDEGETTTHAAVADFIPSNALDILIEGGQGFSVLGYGPFGENEKKTLPVRLPKQDEKYGYFIYGGATEYDTEVRRDADFSKFAWTPDPGKPDTMTVTLTNGSAGNKYLLGNPTMAYIDLVQFMEDNKDVLTGSFQCMNNSAYVGVASSILEISGHRYLAPMEAILVEAKTEGTAINVVFRAEQMTLDNMTYHEAGRAPQVDPASAPRKAAAAEAPALMTITTYTDDMEAVAYLGVREGTHFTYRDGEDVHFISSGVEDGMQNDGDVLTTPLNIYTVSDNTALMVDLRPGISSIPLGFLVHPDMRTDSLQLICNMTDNWATECYLVDVVEGTRQPIYNGLVMTIRTPKNHELRYFIEGPDTYIDDSEQNDQPGVTTDVPVVPAQPADETLVDYPVEKIVINDHVYIRRGPALFDLTGVRVL